MTPEARELYTYVTSVEPFATHIKRVNMDCVSPMIAIRQITRKAIEQYHKDYCSLDANVFSEKDFTKVTDRIYNEKRGTDMNSFEKCVVTLTDKGFNEWDFFTVEEVNPEIRECRNGIEQYGVIVKAWEFVNEYTWYEETYEDINNNTSGEREGRFDCHDEYDIKDTDYKIGAFVVWGDVVCAEIYKDGSNVAYIRIN